LHLLLLSFFVLYLLLLSPHDFLVLHDLLLDCHLSFLEHVIAFCDRQLRLLAQLLDPLFVLDLSLFALRVKKPQLLLFLLQGFLSLQLLLLFSLELL
jgi:hypothetical protein